MGVVVRSIGLVLAASSAPAFAQTPPTTADAPQSAATPGVVDGRTVYAAAYFATYSPSSALQIVERVPGFAIEDIDPSVRGFGQAGGNIVINGQRPSSKTDTLETILSRIPAARVLRVEVGPGEKFGAEYSSKAQVLNLVLSAEGGLAGTVSGGVRREFTGKLFPFGSASALIRSGKSSFNLGVTVTNDRTGEEGYDYVYALPSGTRTELRRKVNHYADPNTAFTASWDYDGGANRTAHVNLRYARDRLRLTQDNSVMPVGGSNRDDLLTQRYNQNDYEIGGDITRPFGGGGLKFIALATRRDRDLRDLSLNRISPNILGGFSQKVNDRLEEKLARLVWNRRNLGGWTVETGGEIALNQLTSKVDLFGLGAGGTPTRIDLPIDNAVVKELRGETFVTAGKGLAKGLRVDLGLTYEISRLTVSGDATAKRTLSFLKPKATFDWRPSKWHLQLALQRTVAQLQFVDFISVAEITNDRVNGGNANLVPQRAWEALLTVERPILGDGLFKLELGYNRVSKVQDRIPTPDGFDAPGNLGDGTIFIVRPRIDLPLGKLGIKGGRLTLYASYVSTSVRDPYTLEFRPFSGNSALYAQATFRQDRGKFAWGFDVSGVSAFTIYRLNENDKYTNGYPFVTAFGEYRPDARTTLRLDLRNLTQASAGRYRHFFTPDRRSPNPVLEEVRVRNAHLIPALTFKRTFA